MLFQLETLVIFVIWANSSKVEGSIQSHCPSKTWMMYPWLFRLFPLKVVLGRWYIQSPKLARNISGILISGIFFSIGWLYITYPTHLFRGTRNNYWLYHGKLPCLFQHLGEYGFTFFGGGTPFLTSKTDSFSACHDETYGCFFTSLPGPKGKTCWVKRFSLWFLPFTHHLVVKSRLQSTYQIITGGWFC